MTTQNISFKNNENYSYIIQNIVMLFEAMFVTLSDYVNGGELFTHLNLREHFTEREVKIYIGEIVLALETLHKVSEYTQSNLSFKQIFSKSI